MASEVAGWVATRGLNSRDRGAKSIGHSLCDVGMDVVYTGLRQMRQQIVRSAIHEDANAIGISTCRGRP